MYVTVRGARLFFDTEGSEWEPRGAMMRRRPTVVLLHGGPGVDHSGYRELGRRLRDRLHVVYLDHRGNGRSDRGAPDDWTLASWAEDVKAFCDALGLEKPIVLGHSFGGYVAQAYAAAYPDHAGKLVLVGTAGRFVAERSVSMFRRLGGEVPAEVARRYFADPARGFPAYLETCFPLYAKTPGHPDHIARMVLNLEVAHHFVGGEMQHFDLCPALGRLEMPVLVLSGGDDVIATPEDIDDLLRALPADRARHRAFPESGHEIFADGGEAAVNELLAFCEG